MFKFIKKIIRNSVKEIITELNTVNSDFDIQYNTISFQKELYPFLKEPEFEIKLNINYKCTFDTSELASYTGLEKILKLTKEGIQIDDLNYINDIPIHVSCKYNNKEKSRCIMLLSYGKYNLTTANKELKKLGNFLNKFPELLI